MSFRIARNRPCPCGSGKKYKNCCMKKSAGLFGEPSSFLVAGRQGSVQGRVIDSEPQFAERPGFADPPQAGTKRRRKSKRLPWEVALLTDKEILFQLSKMGIEVSQEGFASWTERYTAAQEVVLELTKGRKQNLEPEQMKFVHRAVCELWKRWFPRKLCRELVLEWLQQGAAIDPSREDKRCDIWIQIWEAVKPYLTPEMRTVESAESKILKTHFMYNWIQDLGMAFYNAAVKKPEYAEKGIRFMEQVLDQFTEEDELFIMNFMCDLGTLYFRAGREADGEKWFREIIRKNPRKAQPYAHLSDALAFDRRGDKGPRDFERAIQVLEEALAVPVEDAEDFELDVRIADLREQLAKQRSKG